jgi:peptide chain release factor subunit 1
VGYVSRMLVNDVDVARLRRLAALRPQGARVLTLYLDLEPTEFATAPARESELTSALDAAARMADETDLSHDARVAVREDIERVRDALSVDGLDAQGARAIVVFACGPADLFEVLKLPQPVATHVTIDDSPWIEPLVRVAGEPRVAVALIDRHNLRVFHGTAESLEELKPDTREPARHRTATDEEANTHFIHAGEALLRLLKRRGYDALVLGARAEERGAILEHLHPYVRDRLAGDLDADVSSATPDDVRRDAAAVVAKLHERKVGEALARLREGLGRGQRAAAGLDDVQRALDERRVEVLLYERGRAQEKVIENAAEAAVLQDAEVHAIDAAEHPDLGPHGGIGAVLRF